jgi:hypothetical protein
MRDSLTRVQIKRAHSPYYYSTNTAWMSEIIDLQGYDSMYFAIATGDIADADATFTVLMQESDSSTFATANDVADADMVSQTDGTAPETAASFQFDDDNEVRSIGYIGSKRYVRLYITGANNTGVAIVSVTAHLSRASHEPITKASA